jgi:CysZ protein
MSVLTPPMRAMEQLGDPVFVGVLLRSVAWAAVAFVGLAMFSVWGTGILLAGHGVPRWVAGLLGGAGAVGLALLMFLPLAALIATLFIDRIADAVERRHYPGLPPPTPASLAAQSWDGVALGLRVLALQLVALMLAILLPGVGLVLGWFVAAWAIGRGLFVAVAMRRMGRMEAQALYRRRRWAVLTQGGLMSAGSLIPLLNLLSPVLGTAAMVHVLHDQSGIVPQA